MMDSDSFIVTTLERINAKLDKHDDKIDMIVTALTQLVKIDTENKEIKESLGRAFKRIEDIEENQTSDGCPAHKNFLAVRAEQLKTYDGLAKDCKEKHDTLAHRIDAIEDKPKKRIEAAIIEVIKWVTVFIMGAIALKLGVDK